MEFLFSASTVLLAGAIVSAAVFVVTGLSAVRKPSGTRRIYVLLTGALLLMLIRNIGEYQEWGTIVTASGEQPLIAFLGYHGFFIAVSYLIAVLLSLKLSMGVILAVVLNAFPALTLLSWVTESGVETGATVAVLLSVLLGGYLLYGPLNSVSRSVSRKRRLIYTKLRNLFFLCASLLVVLATLSPQNTGITTSFSYQVGITYLDLILIVGVTYIATSEDSVYDHLASTTGSQKMQQSDEAVARGGD